MPGRQAVELHPIPADKRPFETIHMDHLGPFVSSARENKYVIALIDNLTRFSTLKAVRNTKVTLVLETLKDFVLRYGSPQLIITDRGTCYTSQKFTEFCQQQGIVHVLNSPRHLQANGMVQRLNGTLLPAVQSSLKDSDGRDWDARLKYVQRDLNGIANKTTNWSSYD